VSIRAAVHKQWKSVVPYADAARPPTMKANARTSASTAHVTRTGHF